MVMAETTELRDLVSLWLLRWRLREAAIWAVRGLAGGLAAGLGLTLVARLMPLQPVPVLIAGSIAFALGGMALAGGAGFFWPRPVLVAARYFDRRFGLAERTSTALELAVKPGYVPAWLARDQAQDALVSARSINLARQLPFEFRRGEGLAMLALIAAIAVSLYLPNPQQQVLAQQVAVQQAIAEQITQIETIRNEIEENPALIEEQQEALTQPLGQALEQLEEGQLTQEQAVSILQSTEQQLQQLTDPQLEQQSQALQQAGQNLAQSGESRLQEFGQDLAQGDTRGAEAAAQKLANLDLAQLSGEELELMAAQLEGAAEDLAATNPELANQLQGAADAIRNGDTAGAQQALQEAAGTLTQAGQQIEQAQVAQEAADQVAEGMQQVIEAGQSAEGQGEGQQGNGSTGREGQGQEGTGQQGHVEGSQGAGAGRGEGEGEGQGGEAGDDPIGTDNGQGDSGERGYEPIYSPYRLGGSGGPDVGLPGSGEPGDDIVGQGDTSPDDSGRSVVPYNEVFGAYSEAAYQAIDSGTVPIGLRSLVRDYFSSLEP